MPEQDKDTVKKDDWSEYSSFFESQCNEFKKPVPRLDDSAVSDLSFSVVNEALDDMMTDKVTVRETVIKMGEAFREVYVDTKQKVKVGDVAIAIDIPFPDGLDTVYFSKKEAAQAYLTEMEKVDDEKAIDPVADKPNVSNDDTDLFSDIKFDVNVF
jgi:hypothetical protein